MRRSPPICSLGPTLGAVITTAHADLTGADLTRFASIAADQGCITGGARASRLSFIYGIPPCSCLSLVISLVP